MIVVTHLVHRHERDSVGGRFIRPLQLEPFAAVLQRAGIRSQDGNRVRHGMTRARPLGDHPLEALHERPRGEHLAAQDIRYGSDILVVDELPAISEEAFAHRQLAPGTSREIIA